MSSAVLGALPLLLVVAYEVGRASSTDPRASRASSQHDPSKGTTMSTTPTRRQRLRARLWGTRRRRISLTALALVCIGAVAWAAVMSYLGLGGTVARGEFAASWGGAGSPSPTSMVVEIADNGSIPIDGGQVVTGTRIAGGTLNLSDALPELLPGEAVVVAGAAKLDGARKGYISGLQFTGATPAGWHARLLEGCGRMLGSTTPLALNVRMGITPTGTTGAALNASGLRVTVTALPAGVMTPPSNVVCTEVGARP